MCPVGPFPCASHFQRELAAAFESAQAARDSTDAYKTQVAAEREAQLVRAAEREAAWEGSREECERERISEQVLTSLALLVQKYKY